MEAAFRVLYPNEERVPFRALIRRTRDQGILPDNIADLADTAAELRNSFSHPLGAAALSPGMAASMLENTHRLVAVVMGRRRPARDTLGRYQLMTRSVILGRRRIWTAG